MRFKIYLKPTRDRQPLLFNYQYPLQAWIYGLLHHADEAYAAFLHSKGYEVPNSHKTFKHFTFSSLHLPKIDPIKKGDAYITIRSETITFQISFLVDQAAEDFVVGLFQAQQLSLYNREYRADFVVECVEAVPSISMSESMVLKTVSPMVVAKKHNGIDQYLSPADDDFAPFFALNLIDKYRSLQPEPLLQMNALAASKLIKFELLSDPERIKKRGFLAKEGKIAVQTKVIGYHNFTFALTAPPEIIEVGYLGGFGKFCSMGCGCVEIIKNKPLML